MYPTTNPYVTNIYPNPYLNQQAQFYNTQAQRTEIIKVSGRNGAEAFQMGVNSSALLLDETAPIIWLKTTDGAGYPTITPYSITPYQPEPQLDMKTIDERLKKLEDIINESHFNANQYATDNAADTTVETDTRNVKRSPKS